MSARSLSWPASRAEAERRARAWLALPGWWRSLRRWWVV